MWTRACEIQGAAGNGTDEPAGGRAFYPYVAHLARSMRSSWADAENIWRRTVIPHPSNAAIQPF